MLDGSIDRFIFLFQDALRIYERLEAWENVVDCYKSLEQVEKAENLVRKLIEENKSDPMNYCLMGDITLQKDWYEKAIEVCVNAILTSL